MLLNRYTRARGVPTDVLLDILTWVIVGSMAGTRLVWVIGNLDRMDSPAEVLMIWRGGMTLYGGILGGLIAGVIMLRSHGLPVLAMIDLATPAMVIGRISDLITGDHLGTPTDLPWGFRYVGTDPPGQAPPLGTVVVPWRSTTRCSCPSCSSSSSSTSANPAQPAPPRRSSPTWLYCEPWARAFEPLPGREERRPRRTPRHGPGSGDGGTSGRGSHAGQLGR